MRKIKDLINKLLSNPMIEPYRFVIVPVISILICLILITLIIFPHLSSLDQTNKLLKDKEAKKNSLEKKLDILKQTNRAVYEENLQAALASVPKDKEVPGAANQMLFLIANSKMKLDDINFAGAADTGKEGSGLENFRITVTVSGDVTQLKDLIKKIKSATRVMEIFQLEVTGGKASGTVQSTIGVFAFYQAIPTSIGNIEQPISTLTESETTLLSQIKESRKVIPSIPVAETTGGPKGKSNPFQ